MKSHRRLSRAIGIALFALALCSLCMGAELHAQSNDMLRRQLVERDSMIADLVRRVEALEAKLSQDIAADRTIKRPGPPPAPPESASATEEDAVRALERALVREGGLVLAPGGFEIEPRYVYSYRGTDALQLLTVDGQQAIAQQDIKRDMSDFSLGMRLGLPWTSQLDFRLPYILEWEDTATASIERTERKRSGWGDLELGLTKQLIRERGWAPDLLTAVNWKSKTGKTGIGTGFHGIEAGLTAVKRRDPLAFFGTVSHNWSLSGRQAGSDVDLGDTIGVRFGTILAASPDTSLRLAFQMNRSGRAEVDGRKVPGSDTVVGLFEVGLAAVALPRTLFDVAVGIGLTSDSPDLRVSVSLPMLLYHPASW